MSALVWRPLDVGGLRLYRVTVLWASSAEDRFVLATSPNEAKRAVQRGYAEYTHQPTIVAGGELTVLQPEGVET